MIDRALNALAPKLEVGQEALYDALRSRDLSRAARIIERVARGNGGRANSGGAPGRAFGGAVQREKEVRSGQRGARGAVMELTVCTSGAYILVVHLGRYDTLSCAGLARLP